LRHVRQGRVEAPVLLGQGLLDALAPGDVLEGGEPPAIGQRAVRHGEDAAVAQVEVRVQRIAAPGDGDAVGHVGVRVAEIEVPLDAVVEEVEEGRAGAGQVRRQPEQVDIALVADHEPHVAVEHAQALDHVVHGDAEAQVLALDLGLGALGLGDVLVDRDPAAPGHWPVADRDRAPVPQRLLTLESVGRGQATEHARPDLLEARVPVIADLERVSDEVADRRAHMHLVAREAVHGEVLPVHGRDAQVPVQHQEAVGHVGESRREQVALGAQALGGAVALRDVLVGRHPAAVRHRAVDDLDGAPVP
jgi:hypothetical protein